MLLKCFLLFMGFSSSLAFIDSPFPMHMLDNLLKSLKNNLESERQNTFTRGEECKRKCVAGDSKICYFKFILELYPVMNSACGLCSAGVFNDCFHSQCVTANGLERIFTSINRQLPGPQIEVCKHDTVVVDVLNEIEGSSSTLHWHGYAQELFPFMDGVPYITQCPIHFGGTFRYEFNTIQEGTFFYHSHAGHQKANGVQGALIVRANEEKNLYDYDLSEHVIIIADWMDTLMEDFFPGLKNQSTFPQSLLINGRGRYLNKTTNKILNSPLSVFHVNEGKRYKFRIIGASSNICPLQFQIENHNFTVVATDSIKVKPFIADKIFLTAGERFDLIINSNQKSKNLFWIKISTSEPCIDVVEEFAILKYHRGIRNDVERLNLMTVKERNPENEVFESTTELNSPSSFISPITVLESYINDDDLIHSRPQKTFFLSFGTPPSFNTDGFNGNNVHKFIVTQQPLAFTTVGAINKISFEFPKIPLLSQTSEIDENIFCNETNHLTNKCLDNGICLCVHRLIAPEHAIVELIVTNVGDPTVHPFHLHGNQFAVVEVGKFNSSFTEADLKNRSATPKLTKNPVYKDTVIVPKSGFVRLRVRTRSANFLFFHCHFDFHLQAGMAGVLQVGELKSMPKPPPNFPQCRDYIPKYK